MKEPIEGVFYGYELIPTQLPSVFDFEIISSSKDRITGKKRYLVQWVGYPPKFNSYVNESDIE